MPSLRKIHLILIAVFPLGILTTKNWSGGMLFLLALISLLILLREQTYPDNAAIKLFSLVLAAPFLAIFISQSVSGHWVLSYYDSPFRFLLAIPIMLSVYKMSDSILKSWAITIPLSLVLTAILLPHLPQIGWAGIPDRVTVYFIDPLTFGWITLALSLVCLSLIEIDKFFCIKNLILILGSAIGIYLSIKSGSRTGWLATPILLCLIIFFKIKLHNKFAKLTLTVLLPLTFSFLAYCYNNTIHERINVAVKEVLEYKFNEINPETSVGQRISFLRFGYHYFSLRPLTGWGDQSFAPHVNDSSISVFATEHTRLFALNAGFHNEIVTNAVRSGIWGLLSSIFLLISPVVYFYYQLVKKINLDASLVGITFTLTILVASLTTEVFNLKHTASFSALFLSCLIAASCKKTEKTK